MARNSSRKRINPNLTGKIKVVVIGEGATEKAYFNRLNEINYFKHLSISFKELGSKDKWRSILISTLASIGNSDCVVLLLDVDDDPTKMKEIERLIKKDYGMAVLKKVLFYNNRTFELFLLNHKINYKRPAQRSTDYDQEIKRQFNLDSYDKTEAQLIRIMKQIEVLDVDLAIERMRGITQDYHLNPSSTMGIMFDNLNQVKR